MQLQQKEPARQVIQAQKIARHKPRRWQSRASNDLDASTTRALISTRRRARTRLSAEPKPRIELSVQATWEARVLPSRLFRPAAALPSLLKRLPSMRVALITSIASTCELYASDIRCRACSCLELHRYSCSPVVNRQLWRRAGAEPQPRSYPSNPALPVLDRSSAVQPSLSAMSCLLHDARVRSRCGREPSTRGRRATSEDIVPSFSCAA